MLSTQPILLTYSLSVCHHYGVVGGSIFSNLYVKKISPENRVRSWQWEPYRSQRLPMLMMWCRVIVTRPAGNPWKKHCFQLVVNITMSISVSSYWWQPDISSIQSSGQYFYSGKALKLMGTIVKQTAVALGRYRV